MKFQRKQLFFLICLVGSLVMNVPWAHGFESQNLVGYVDPRNATESPGNCVIGPQVPWGSINPSPAPNGGTNGYTTSTKIRGFSQTALTYPASSDSNILIDLGYYNTRIFWPGTAGRRP